MQAHQYCCASLSWPFPCATKDSKRGHIEPDTETSQAVAPSAGIRLCNAATKALYRDVYLDEQEKWHLSWTRSHSSCLATLSTISIRSSTLPHTLTWPQLDNSKPSYQQIALNGSALLQTLACWPCWSQRSVWTGRLVIVLHGCEPSRHIANCRLKMRLHGHVLAICSCFIQHRLQ